MSFWRKLNHLVPEPDCNTKGGVITEWRDGRAQPTDVEIDAVDIADVEAAELEAQAVELSDVKKALSSLAELLYENPDLVASFATVGDFKTALKDRFKAKL